jgi:ribose transport system substrate-binding protein
MISLLMGCGGSNTTSTDTVTQNTTPRPSKPKVALIMKSLANEFFKTMESGALRHQVEHMEQYDLICNGIKDEQDMARQIELVEQMVAAQVNAIVIAPADSKALVGVCQKAQAAGIMVVNIDNKFDDVVLTERQVKFPFVGPDNRKGAALAGDFLASHLQPGDSVAILEGVPTAFNAIQRKSGFTDAIEKGGLKLVTSQSGLWETEKANQVAAGILTEYPDLKAFLCANDNMALGVVAAIKAAGKQKQVQVVGFDNIQAIQELIREGSVLCTVDQHADQLAIFGIEYALEMLKNKQVPVDKETPVDLVTLDTLNKSQP